MSDFFEDFEDDGLQVSDAVDAAALPAEVQVSGYTLKLITETVSAKLAQDARSTLQSGLQKAVSKAVEIAVDDEICEQIREHVKDCIAQGWQKTNEYGSATGPRITIQDRINEILIKANDRYGNRSFTSMADEIIKSEFKPEIEEAKKRFREMIDATMKSKLAEVLKESLGLR